MEADETHKLAAALNVSDKIIFVHVLQIGKVKKLDESSTDNHLCSIARLLSRLFSLLLLLDVNM